MHPRGDTIEEKDAHLEFIESKEIERLVNLIYTSNPEQTVINAENDVNPSNYSKMIQKIDGLQIKDGGKSLPKI